jgi:hypothetical protein
MEPPKFRGLSQFALRPRSNNRVMEEMNGVVDMNDIPKT